MDQLIPVINRLQDVFNTVGERESLELPQIVVVGEQSSGKSSVLENVVGRDFLPRGSGIVTRVPLVMQLINVPPPNKRRGVGRYEDMPEAEEWGTFLHAPGKIFADFEDIRQEIQEQTNRLCGSHQNIKNTPINLKIFSPHVLNLTLVDLPGLTKVPVGDQPKDIEQQIRSLLLEYIENPNSIILAVSPANADIANSDSIKLAKEVDPDGERTLAVVTKIDLMDRGTDAKDILNGKVIPVKLGIIGVVNRSQYDINHSVPIREAVKNEKRFFEKNYKEMAHRCGVEYLSKMLNTLLMHHIRHCLPGLRQRIKTLQTQTQAALDALGQPLSDSMDESATMLNAINKFVESFKASIQGTNVSLPQTPEPVTLSGGACINAIFYDEFGATIRSMDPMDGLTEQDVVAEIRNAAGPRRALFVPEIAFEMLVKRQIKKLEFPSMQCVDLIHDQLVKVMQSCLGVPPLARFDRLREEIAQVTSTMLRSCLPDTRQMVRNLVEIQMSYINTNHPQFGSGADAVLKTMARVAKEGEEPADPPLLDGPESDGEDEPVMVEHETAMDHHAKSAAAGGGVLDLLFGRGKGRHHHKHHHHGGARSRSPVAPAADEALHSRPAVRTPKAVIKTKGDELQVELIEQLIRDYFAIVAVTIQDSVPKAIMHFLVNKAQESIHHELVRSLYKPDMFHKLLEEDPHISRQRREAAEMLDALSKASSILHEVNDVKYS